MRTTETKGLSSVSLAELQAAAAEAANGIRDLEAARQAAREVDRIREQNRQRFGDRPVGVEIIREFRGPLPE